MTIRSSCLRLSLPRRSAIIWERGPRHGPRTPPVGGPPARISSDGPGVRGDAGDAGEAREGEAEGVGDVRGPWQVLEAEQRLDAALDLRLAGRAAARHRALDLRRRQRRHAHAELAGGQIDNSPSLAHEDCGARKLVLGVEVLEI